MNTGYIVRYKDKELNVKITNVAVLEAIENFEKKREAFNNCKSLREISDNIISSGEEIQKIVEKSGGNFSNLFPDPDYADFLEFIGLIDEAIKTQKLEIK